MGSAISGSTILGSEWAMGMAAPSAALTSMPSMPDSRDSGQEKESDDFDKDFNKEMLCF